MKRLPVIGLLLALVLGWPIELWAEQLAWPKGFEEVSNSPNGRYGVLVPDRDQGAELDDSVNYLADLKEHKVMAKILGIHYALGLNRRWLKELWSNDSKCCILVDDYRFGYGGITIVDLHDDKIVQTEIGKRMDKVMNAVIAKQSPQKDAAGEGTAYFRFGPEGRLKVRAISATNPKRFEDQKTYGAFFRGTFDLKTRKWLLEEVRPVTGEPVDELIAAYAHSAGDPSADIGEPSEESLDIALNAAYTRVRAAVTPERFAALKREQIQWLKQRDASPTAQEKLKRIARRIKDLEQFLWE